ncbi:hypothetical protein swp_2912 [Shewanella piezotolerans WP3]|uniref:Uncharacterized protein n=1 Tax=Shewanella piezotolerans (strain WP3 / JCM 13877) TaxID=225849 RepID=B8CQW6_SHEPW|nr:hypothetical protein swp_2912 [Shewanella piezotolerans WP3]
MVSTALHQGAVWIELINAVDIFCRFYVWRL